MKLSCVKLTYIPFDCFNITVSIFFSSYDEFKKLFTSSGFMKVNNFIGAYSVLQC